MKRIEIIIAIIALLGGFFGVPEGIKSVKEKVQRSDVENKAKYLKKQIASGSIKAGIEEYSFSRYPVFCELKELLWEAKDAAGNKEFLQKELNDIISELYAARVRNEAKGIDEALQEINAKFHKYFDFSEQSWANIAIANMNLYRLDGMSEYREYCLEACKESIKRLGNYGTPRAVMLIIHMIDYERKKQVNKDDLLNMINEINSGDDMLVSYGTYKYLADTKKIQGWERYINHIFELYPEEMDEMKNRADSGL